jgi:spermidine/putrescine transport system ATP-binding protein
MSQNIVEIRQVDKSFQDNRVLKGINIDIKSGEFLTLLGPSGCGKTTLLRLISGFEEPDCGSILINGKKMHGISPDQRHVNTVFQSYALFPHMTVFENIAFGLRCKRLNEKNVQDKVNCALQMVKLDHLKNRKPHKLSGGQQQRVAIARAVVNEPLVLLLDEPLNALDYGLRKNMQIELKALQRQLGITFVFVTHDQEEALSMSDRVVVMNDGIIEQVGTPRNIYETPRNLYVAKFVGEANIFETVITKFENKFVWAEIEGVSFKLEVDQSFKIGQQVSIVIRPEDMQAWDNTEVDESKRKNMIHAKVEQVIYKGSTVDLILRADGGKRLSATEFFDEEDEDLDFRVGESVWIEWTLGWEVILPHDE